MMQALDKDLRRALEKTVKAARTAAEAAAQAAVEQLGVGHDKPETFLSDDEKALRNRLRTHGKQLGDARDSKSTNPTYGKQEVLHLVQEVAYQHWHRMLFARFLADNSLLMYDGVAVTIEECDELAPVEGAKSGWELAGKLAAHMLPQVFKPDSPVFELTFAPEHQSELERLLKDLPDAVFKASDSLGWVYQFWQADNKDRINKSEVKIGADELPAVTQLFTEPYMVAFLLDNSLGAWWASRRLTEDDFRHAQSEEALRGKAALPGVPLKYLRFVRQEGGMWVPAAGAFPSWPERLADLKMLDPCCGSGHFLVAALLMLVPMRMEQEGLSAHEAMDTVLRDNLHGLEIDPRCVEIAVFAVALEAWRYPDASGKPLGVREIPAPNIACCGLKVAAKAQDWEALVPNEVPNAIHLRQGLKWLHRLFAQAPLLGSLLSPNRQREDLFAADYAELQDLLHAALAREDSIESEERRESALSALGLFDAARLMERRYHLVVTNPPYLGASFQHDVLREYCGKQYPIEKHELATVFQRRCVELSRPSGTVALVMPQNWLTQPRFERARESILEHAHLALLARLGEGGFVSPQASGAFVVLEILHPSDSSEMNCSLIDAAPFRGSAEKARFLASAEPISRVQQSRFQANPDSIISFDMLGEGTLLHTFGKGWQGLITSDDNRFTVQFWEIADYEAKWRPFQWPPTETEHFTGLSSLIRWEEGKGALHLNSRAHNFTPPHLFGKLGVAIQNIRSMNVSLYLGGVFAANVSAFVPENQCHLPAIWTYCQTDQFRDAVRRLTPRTLVSPGTYGKVPFDSAYWARVASKIYPNGLPQPYSDDPTQWIFHGHPCGSVIWNEQTKRLEVASTLRTDAAVLQVAVARLLGYRWPAELYEGMELAGEQRKWVRRCAELGEFADQDGIVCIPPVRGEAAAADRLLNLLAAAYGNAWNSDTLSVLLAAADHAGKSLETWLRDKFFAQHCKLFQSRPFIWHIWDGLRDGFSALANYHRLDHKNLETLIYTYLGDWIARQKQDIAAGVDGAQERLAAAEALKKRLELILEGEAPHDIFVRWKPLERQPIGWEPDLNDGVRLNIRPFMSVPDVKKAGAGVLRDKPNIKWEKDRGKDVASAPWFPVFHGDRINNHHLTLAEKQEARARKGA